jgi:hypothetical protein
MSLLFCVLTAASVLMVVAAILVFRMKPEPDVQIVFAKAYLKTYRGTRDRKESLLAALAVLRKRAPFSEVSDDDAAFLADLFGRLHHPHIVLGHLLRLADDKRTVGSLRNRAHLQMIIEGALAQGA